MKLFVGFFPLTSGQDLQSKRQGAKDWQKGEKIPEALRSEKKDSGGLSGTGIKKPLPNFFGRGFERLLEFCLESEPDAQLDRSDTADRVDGFIAGF
jgi:hypothetical protein